MYEDGWNPSGILRSLACLSGDRREPRHRFPGVQSLTHVSQLEYLGVMCLVIPYGKFHRTFETPAKLALWVCPVVKLQGLA